jgi:hypothetical protein
MTPLPPPSPVKTCEGPLPRGEGWEGLVEEAQPVLFRGAAAHWPLVAAARESGRAAAEHIAGFHSGKPVVVYRAEPSESGRFAYNPDLTGFNFTSAREELAPVLDEILAGGEGEGAASIYIGSTDLGIYFPGLDEANSLRLSEVHPALAQGVTKSIWLGNRTTATCHYDFSHNIAVCAAGRRRFTLFPPDQVANLYPGPLDPTPGGQVVSMVDFTSPDLARHPHFSEAWSHAQIAEMEPGDVLAYPAMWWHHVEALGPFNALVNYWWDAVPGYFDSPQVTLLHAMLSLRDRPTSEKAAWKAVFDHYIFGDPDAPRAHLPEHILGPLAAMDEHLARKLRALVTRKLQR